MKIIPIINRIKSECASFETRVEPAQSLEALPDDDVKNNLPMAFPYISDDDSPGADTMQGDYRKNVRFSVITVCRNIDIDAGEEPLDDLRTELKTGLVGFQPTANHDPIQWVSGKIISTSRRMVWWVDTFETFIDQ